MNKRNEMKKIPILISSENILFMNNKGLSFAKVVNNAIDQIRALSSETNKELKWHQKEKSQDLMNLTQK